MSDIGGLNAATLPPLLGISLSDLSLFRPEKQHAPTLQIGTRLSDEDLQVLRLSAQASADQIKTLNANENAFLLSDGFQILVGQLPSGNYYHKDPDTGEDYTGGFLIIVRGFFKSGLGWPSNVFKELSGQLGSNFLAGQPKSTLHMYKAPREHHFEMYTTDAWDWKPTEGVYGQKAGGSMQTWSEPMKLRLSALALPALSALMTHILSALKMRDVTELYKNDATEDGDLLYVTFADWMDPFGSYVYAVSALPNRDGFEFKVRGNSPYSTVLPPPRFRTFWTLDLISMAFQYAHDINYALEDDLADYERQRKQREPLMKALRDAQNWQNYLLNDIENGEGSTDVLKRLWNEAWGKVTDAALESGLLAQPGLQLSQESEDWRRKWVAFQAAAANP